MLATPDTPPTGPTMSKQSAFFWWLGATLLMLVLAAPAVLAGIPLLILWLLTRATKHLPGKWLLVIRAPLLMAECLVLLLWSGVVIWLAVPAILLATPVAIAGALYGWVIRKGLLVSLDVPLCPSDTLDSAAKSCL